MGECADLVKAAILLVNERNKCDLVPINFSDVTFRDYYVAEDTFIPGNEAYDEKTIIVATIPLKWNDKPKH